MDGETSKVAGTEGDIAAVTTTTTTVYVFFENEVKKKIFGWSLWCSDGYSLYGIDITMPIAPAQEEQGWDVKQPKLLARIPDDGRELDGMVCAQLGSKFYFLGGYIQHFPDFPEDSHPPLGTLVCRSTYEFLPDVFVYDPTHPHTFTKDPVSRVAVAKPMNSGKYHPLTFESKGKLYVLSKLYEASICLFEEYDPVKDCWTVLHTHPGFDLDWCGTSVLNSGKVLTLGSSEETIYSFDPDTHVWSELIKLDTGNMDLISFFAEDNFYKLKFGGLVGPELAKIGPISSFEDCRHHYSCRWASVDATFISDVMVCHLGHSFLCVIGTAPGKLPGFYQDPDPHRRCLDLTIYKDLHEYRNLFGLDLKCLHQSSFEIRSEFNSLGRSQCCYVKSAVENNTRVHHDDKKIETNTEVKKKVHFFENISKNGYRTQVETGV